MSTSYGVLSTYPPTQCGLATFSSALVQSLRSPKDVVGIVDIVDVAGAPRRPEIHHQWVRGQEGGAEAAAVRLNGYDVVIVHLTERTITSPGSSQAGCYSHFNGVPRLDEALSLTKTS